MEDVGGLPNKFTDVCCHCRGIVNAGTGRAWLVKHNTWIAAHISCMRDIAQAKREKRKLHKSAKLRAKLEAKGIPWQERRS